MCVILNFLHFKSHEIRMGTDLEMYGLSGFDVFNGQSLWVAQSNVGQTQFRYYCFCIYFLLFIHTLNVMISN